MDNTYLAIASKTAFNKALRHFFSVSGLVDDVESSKNLADLINSELDDGELSEEQILPAVGAIIRDKYGYSFKSCNITSSQSEFVKIVEETISWTALDLLVVYYDPNDKVILINPKNADHWSKAGELHHDQLVVIYARHLKEGDKKIEMKAISTLEDLLSGRGVSTNRDFIDTTIVPKPPSTQAKPEVKPVVSKNITPKYAVAVSNELFHNGNVEAWKKIIESYKVKFPQLQVHIFFEGELINDINALFKWGKVKHGDSIFFQVSGEDIKGVSKLQKYLYEGASHRFEQFLKIGVGQVLNLF